MTVRRHRFESPTPLKRLAVIANSQKPGARLAIEQIRAWAGDHGACVVTNLDSPGAAEHPAVFGPPGEEELRAHLAGSDLAITLGGDGTLLYSARIIAPLGIPLLSVNLGSVGFHTQAEPQELPACLEAVRHGEYRIEKRLLLEVSLESPAAHCPPEDAPSVPPGPTVARSLALNDVVISKSSWGHMVHVRLHVDGKPVSDVDADSLVVATPTGSSAYNYAADGPVIVPWMEAMVVNAICPHRMNLAPLILSPECQLAVRAYRRSLLEEAQVLVDGQPWQTLSPDGCLKISRSPLYLPLIVFHDDFYEKLRVRLRWGGLN